MYLNYIKRFLYYENYKGTINRCFNSSNNKARLPIGYGFDVSKAGTKRL